MMKRTIFGKKVVAVLMGGSMLILGGCGSTGLLALLALSSGLLGGSGGLLGGLLGGGSGV